MNNTINKLKPTTSKTAKNDVDLLKRVGRPRYWVCIIGPISDDKLPDGADSPPRMAARQAVVEMTGVDTTCRSGWCDEAEYQRIMDAQYRFNK